MNEAAWDRFKLLASREKHKLDLPASYDKLSFDDLSKKQLVKVRVLTGNSSTDFMNTVVISVGCSGVITVALSAELFEVVFNSRLTFKSHTIYLYTLCLVSLKFRWCSVSENDINPTSTLPALKSGSLANRVSQSNYAPVIKQPNCEALAQHCEHCRWTFQ